MCVSICPETHELRKPILEKNIFTLHLDCNLCLFVPCSRPSFHFVQVLPRYKIQPKLTWGISAKLELDRRTDVTTVKIPPEAANQRLFGMAEACNITARSGNTKGYENAVTATIKGELQGMWFFCLRRYDERSKSHQSCCCSSCFVSSGWPSKSHIGRSTGVSNPAGHLPWVCGAMGFPCPRCTHGYRIADSVSTKSQQAA